MIIDNDLFSSAGKVRVRATTPDPHALLGGRGYVEARGLDRAMPDHAAAAAAIKAAAVENLTEALNSGRLSTADSASAVALAMQRRRRVTYIFLSGSVDFFVPGMSSDRRFWAVMGDAE